MGIKLGGGTLKKKHLPFVEAYHAYMKQLIKDILYREERLLYLSGKPTRTKDEQAELDAACTSDDPEEL